MKPDHQQYRTTPFVKRGDEEEPYEQIIQFWLFMPVGKDAAGEEHGFIIRWDLYPKFSNGICEHNDLTLTQGLSRLRELEKEAARMLPPANPVQYDILKVLSDRYFDAMHFSDYKGTPAEQVQVKMSRKIERGDKNRFRL